MDEITFTEDLTDVPSFGKFLYEKMESLYKNKQCFSLESRVKFVEYAARRINMIERENAPVLKDLETAWDAVEAACEKHYSYDLSTAKRLILQEMEYLQNECTNWLGWIGCELRVCDGVYPTPPTLLMLYISKFRAEKLTTKTWTEKLFGQTWTAADLAEFKATDEYKMLIDRYDENTGSGESMESTEV